MTKIGDYDITKHLTKKIEINEDDEKYLTAILDKAWNKSRGYTNVLPGEEGGITDIRIRLISSRYQELDTEFLKMPLKINKSNKDYHLPRFGIYSYSKTNCFLIHMYESYLESDKVLIKICNDTESKCDECARQPLPDNLALKISDSITPLFGSYPLSLTHNQFGILLELNDSKSRKIKESHNINRQGVVFKSYMKTFLTDEFKLKIDESKKYFSIDQLYFIVENDSKDFRNDTIFKDNIVVIGNIANRDFLIGGVAREDIAKYIGLVQNR